MTKQERNKKVEESGILFFIGAKVKAENPKAFRYGDIAQIIGWKIGEKDKIQFLIKFENDECTIIDAKTLSGYSFVDTKSI